MATLFQQEQIIAFAILALLSAVGLFTDVIPIQINITLHSMLIIAIGAYKSMEEMIKQIKRIHVDKLGGDDGIEQMGMSDAIQFPIVAGATLCGLYFSMQYFGKEIVNHLLLAYIAVGGTIGVKSMLFSFTGETFAKYDEGFLVDFSIKAIGLEVQITRLDIPCFFVSAIQMLIYALTKSALYNNILAFIFCMQALQTLFIGNFKNGFMLLTLLFFYDIFFVFGTDVMLTVAKGIDAPIKLMFPKDFSGEKPQYSILGLGDIVIPGIFVSLCLRFDVLKTVDKEHLVELIQAERKGTDVGVVKYLMNKALAAPKSYFYAVNVGYLFAIIATIVVMLLFEHGQPALLYLVPGCIVSVLATAAVKGEISTLLEFSEDEFITPGEDEDDKKQN